MTISTQVLQEMFVVLTRKLKPAVPTEAAGKVLRWLSRNETIVVRPETILRAIEILGEYRISFGDSLIVACAAESRCEVLYTEDLQDGQSIAGVSIRNPLHEEAGA